MSDVNFQNLKVNMLPAFHSLVNSLFDEDYDLFLEYHLRLFSQKILVYECLSLREVEIRSPYIYIQGEK